MPLGRETLSSTERGLLDRNPWLSVWQEDVRLPNSLRIEGYLREAVRQHAF